MFCACAETAEFPVKMLTPNDPLTPISFNGNGRRFLLTFAFDMLNVHHTSTSGLLELKKGKERKSIYTAPFCSKVHTQCSGVDHTVLPANNTMPAFPS